MGWWIAIYQTSSGTLGYRRFQSEEWANAYQHWLNYRVDMKFSCSLRALIVDDGTIFNLRDYVEVEIYPIGTIPSYMEKGK